MMYKEHLLGGIVTSIIIGITIGIYTGNIYYAGISILTTVYMAIYPDMDTGSIPRRYLSVLGAIALIILFYYKLDNYIQNMLIISLILLVPTMFKHRGMAHTIKFGVLVSYLLYVVISSYIDIPIVYVMLPGLGGFLTHMTLDSHFRI